MVNPLVPSLTLNIPWMRMGETFDKLWTTDPTGPEDVPDSLATMFAQQFLHMQAYNEFSRLTLDPDQLGDLDDPLVQDAIRRYAGYVNEELVGEAISDHLKNKPWKQSTRSVDREAFIEELADAWHFFIELHLIAGVTPEEVFRVYFKKSLENARRRAEGY